MLPWIFKQHLLSLAFFGFLCSCKETKLFLRAVSLADPVSNMLQVETDGAAEGLGDRGALDRLRSPCDTIILIFDPVLCYLQRAVRGNRISSNVPRKNGLFSPEGGIFYVSPLSTWSLFHFCIGPGVVLEGGSESPLQAALKSSSTHVFCIFRSSGAKSRAHIPRRFLCSTLIQILEKINYDIYRAPKNNKVWRQFQDSGDSRTAINSGVFPSSSPEFALEHFLIETQPRFTSAP